MRETSHLNGVNYELIIEQVWQQFQMGESIFSKEGGLSHWLSRQISIEDTCNSIITEPETNNDSL